MASGLVLSLFPGVGLLDRAFRDEGYCVVTGPEKLFGGDVRELVGLAGRFDGIIGGPPCQDFSSARRGPRSGDGVAMLREYLRLVQECRPTWWLLENVPRCPDVRVGGYGVQRLDIWDIECGGVQRRCRHIQFGHVDSWVIRPRRDALPGGQSPRAARAVAAVMARTFDSGRFARHCRRQGLCGPIVAEGLRRRALWVAVGNGVPMTMGRRLAAAVAAAAATQPGCDCECGCGRPVEGRRFAGPACRKRAQRARRGDREVVTYCRDALSEEH